MQGRVRAFSNNQAAPWQTKKLARSVIYRFFRREWAMAIPTASPGAAPVPHLHQEK
jgi:hypothetical protein